MPDNEEFPGKTMSMYAEFALLSAFAFLYSVIAGRLERTPITGPILFITFGLLLGPFGAGWLKDDVATQGLRVLADLTLALVLFIDAAGVDISVLKSSTLIPRRMLFVGLPGTIVLGFAAGLLLFDGLSMYELAVLAVMLAATDAALGKGVITNKVVPARLREGLNLESGLNDGLCVPVLLVFIALAESGSTASDSAMLTLKFVTREIGIGLAVGIGISAMGAGVISLCRGRGWLTDLWIQMPVIMLAVLCFTVAQTLHGSGYIAVFSGGILFGILAGKSTHELVLAAEGMGEFLAMLTWTIFGVSAIGKAYEFFSWQVGLYALLSLTVVRMLPVFLSLTGTGEKTISKLFLGWFGPRGLASIVFAIIVLDTNLPGARFMTIVVICTVFLSAIAHGVTANPLASVLAAKVLKNGDALGAGSFSDK